MCVSIFMHVYRDRICINILVLLHSIYVLYTKNHQRIFSAWLKGSHRDGVGVPLANYCTGNSHFSQMHQENSHPFVKPSAILNMQFRKRQMVSTANLHEHMLRLSLLCPPPHASICLGQLFNSIIGRKTLALNIA